MNSVQSRIAIPSPKPWVALLVLGALSIPLIFMGIDRYGVVGSDEAFYQDIALGMLDRGDFFELRSGGAIYVYDTFANAPIQYWARATVAAVLGKSMLSMRILSALSALFAVWMTYRMILFTWGRRAAFTGGLVLLTSFQFLYLHSARTGELEPTVCLILVSCAYLFIRNLADPSRHWLLHHLLLAALFNIKAPIVFIPVAAELIAFALISGARSRLGGWLKWGLFIAPLALLWHGYQAFQYPEQVRSVITAVGHQMSGDFAVGPGGGFFGRALYYGEKLLFGSFPYILLYPLALIRAGGQALGRDATAPDKRQATQILLIYLFTVLAFYVTISKVGPWYIVHAYPFLAALVGLYLAGLHQQKKHEPAGLAAICLALSLAFWLKPEIAGYNPFSMDAYVIPMQTAWRNLPYLDPRIGAVVLAVAILAGLLAWQRRSGSRFSPGLALALFAAFIGYGGIRSLAPLAYVDHLSPVAALDADLRQRANSGAPIPFPVDVPRTHPWVVNYYFYRDFDLRVSSREAPPAYRKPMEYLLLGWKPGRETQSATR
jgi:4-amino-4-deoxy-L-arabinose transferase-like glycosyltransferase